ncbi:hypothetical protein BDF14DRAFT_1770439 [Spinellus fusiger]|nr:hypothetical protein BDF14DRAFT_1770439 [Spinellus fusiger]
MIGPAIPAHLIKAKKSKDAVDEVTDTSNKGALLPLEIVDSAKETVDTAETSDVDEDAYMPALPPDMIEERQKATEKVQTAEKPQGRRRRQQPAGPLLPTYPLAYDSEEEDIGPVLPTNYNADEAATQSTLAAIEAHVHRTITDKKEESSGKVERPEWMLLPPEVDYLKSANSKKSRTFNNRQLTEEERDSSGWTSTPGDTSKKSKSKVSSAESERQREKDRRIRKTIEQYNKSERPVPLIEMHNKKKRVVEDISRQPFDRERDILGYKPVSKKQKSELLRQSTGLGDRFGNSSRSSFL